MKDFVPQPHDLNVCGVPVTGHCSGTRTGGHFRGLKTWVGPSISSFPRQPTSQSVGLRAAFRSLCQPLPFPFCTDAEKVNFVSFVQHHPLQILCVSNALSMLFRRNHKNLLYSFRSLQDANVYIFNRLLTLFGGKWEEISFSQKCFCTQFIHFPTRCSVSQSQPLLWSEPTSSNTKPTKSLAIQWTSLAHTL